MFAYCLDNPICYIDPSGNAAETIFSDNTDINSGPYRKRHGGGGIGGLILGFGLIYAANGKKPPNLPSHKKVKLDLDHISSGHMPGGNRNPDGRKSVFWGLTTNQVIKAIYEAYKTSSKIQTQGDRIRLIGYSNSYNLVIEIWLNVVTKIIETAYPK